MNPHRSPNRRKGPKYLDEAGIDALPKLFNNEHPLELEIGSGKGKFLLARAQAHPEVNFVGIDYIWKFLKIGHTRAEKRNLTNLHYFKAEANEVIDRYTPSGSISVCHIYFPDPWHKRRHNKRRLLTADFFRRLHDRISNDGSVQLATDNFDYLVAFRSSIAEVESMWASIRETRNERIFEPEIKTNFELKYEAEGRDLYYIELRK